MKKTLLLSLILLLLLGTSYSNTVIVGEYNVQKEPLKFVENNPEAINNCFGWGFAAGMASVGIAAYLGWTASQEAYIENSLDAEQIQEVTEENMDFSSFDK